MDAAKPGNIRPNHAAKTSEFLKPKQLVPESGLEVGIYSYISVFKTYKNAWQSYLVILSVFLVGRIYKFIEKPI